MNQSSEIITLDSSIQRQESPNCQHDPLDSQTHIRRDSKRIQPASSSQKKQSLPASKKRIGGEDRSRGKQAAQVNPQNYRR